MKSLPRIVEDTIKYFNALSGILCFHKWGEWTKEEIGLGLYIYRTKCAKCLSDRSQVRWESTSEWKIKNISMPKGEAHVTADVFTTTVRDGKKITIPYEANFQAKHPSELGRKEGGLSGVADIV